MTSTNGCTTTTTVPFTVHSKPDPMTVTISKNPACLGDGLGINVNYGSGNTIVSFTDPSTITRTGGSGFPNGFGFGAYATSVGTGNFVGVSTNAQGCSTTTTVPFTVNALPIAQTVSITPNPGCEGGAVSVSVGNSSGNTGTLTRPSMVGASTNGGGNQSGYGYTAPVTAAGTGNFVSTTTSPQGCSTVVSIPFTALPRPAVPTISSTGTLICSGSPILLSTATTGTTYQWIYGTSWLTGATNSTYSATAAGTYTMRITDANACSNTSAGIALTSNATLAAPRVHVDDATDVYCSSAPVAMKVGTALQLNGTNQYVNVPGFNFPASGSGQPNGGPVTVEFWIHSNGNYNSAFSIGGLNNPNRAVGVVPHSDGNLYWDYGNTAGNGRLSIPYAAYVNKWTHVALVSAGNGGSFKAIYLNGVQVASSTAASDGPDVSLSGLTIGNWLNNYAGAKIDEFRIWNKVLSTNEVQAAMRSLYDTGTPNLMGSWGFDEASGTTVNNDAFSAQTGTIMNSATRVYPTTGLTYTWAPSANLNTGTGTTVIPNTSVVRTYTVKGVDANGCSAYAQVVATPNTSCKEVESEQGSDLVRTEWDVEVYPNPTEGNVQISFIQVSEEAKLSIEVIGMDGAVIFSIDPVGLKEVVNLHELPGGLYLIRVKNGEEIKTKKVVVVK